MFWVHAKHHSPESQTSDMPAAASKAEIVALGGSNTSWEEGQRFYTA